MRRLWDRRIPFSVAGIALVAALLRLPFLHYPATIDDGGFYLVGQSWLHGGTSLYGDYWVDRPPGLIAIFALAAATGHFVVIRLIALLAVVVLILAVARTAHVLGGSAIWAAAVAASLTLTPLFGAELDPGELLAGAFAALAFLVAVEARRTSGGRALALAAVAGLLGVTAASVKQDFVDGLVAATVLYSVDWLVSNGSRTRSALLLLAGAGGALVGVLVIVAVSAVAMPGPHALFDAVVTFRIDAGPILAHSPGTRLAGRIASLGRRSLWSGLLTLGLALAFVAVRRIRSSNPAGLAVAAGIAISVIGIVGGGGGWSHYLIGPAVWVAIGAGLAFRSIVTRAAVAIVVISCAVMVVNAVHTGPTKQWRDARVIGRTIHSAAQAGDTAITLYGVANIQLSTGLRSPYPYLWSLPMRVRDPKLDELRALVAGPDAPTWIVQTNGAAFTGPDRGAFGAVVTDRYRKVSDVCGSVIWLLTGQERTIPRLVRCRGI